MNVWFPLQKSKQKLRFLLNKTAAQTVAAIMKKLKVKDVREHMRMARFGR